MEDSDTFADEPGQWDALLTQYGPGDEPPEERACPCPQAAPSRFIEDADLPF